MLTLEGYDVAEAGDGESALDAVRCDAPHLVLLDVSLPNRSGLDLLEDLRHTTDVPVILVTGSDEEGDRAAGLRLGADDYIVKPFAAADFTARVESVLRRSPALESGTAIRPPRGLSRDLRPSGGAS
jgi:two-component system response regulator BaeR